MFALYRKPFVLLCLLSLLTQFLIISCDSAKSRAKRIISLRSDRKLILDELYTDYGGSELAISFSDSIKSEANTESNVDKEVAEGLADIAQNYDRKVFEEKIILLGHGENLLLFSEKSRKFFSREDVIKKAKKVYEITLELELLENSRE